MVSKRISKTAIKKAAREKYEKARSKLKRAAKKRERERVAAQISPLQRIKDQVMAREAARKSGIDDLVMAREAARKNGTDDLAARGGPAMVRRREPPTSIFGELEPEVEFDAQGRVYLAPLGIMTELGDGVEE